MFDFFRNLFIWSVRNLLVRPLGWIATLVGSIVTFVIALLTAYILDLEGMVKEVVIWVVNKFWELFHPAVDALLGLLPTNSQPSISSILDFLKAANEWVPIDLAVTLGGVLLTFWSVALLYRAVKSFIPTISG